MDSISPDTIADLLWWIIQCHLDVLNVMYWMFIYIWVNLDLKYQMPHSTQGHTKKHESTERYLSMFISEQIITGLIDFLRGGAPRSVILKWELKGIF